MSDEEDDLVRRLQAKVEAEWPEPLPVDFEGPGPFELPLFGSNVSLLTHDDKVVLIELETAEREQRIFLPISTAALAPLKALIDHAVGYRGLGQKKH